MDNGVLFWIHPVDCLCQCHQPQTKEVCGAWLEGEYDEQSDGTLVQVKCTNSKPCPDHEARGEVCGAKIAARPLMDCTHPKPCPVHEAKPPAWEEEFDREFSQGIRNILTRGHVATTYDIKSFIAKLLSSSEKAVRVETNNILEAIRMAFPDHPEFCAKRGPQFLECVQCVITRAALKVDLKEETI